MYYIMNSYFMKDKLFDEHISTLDKFSILIAASIHDIGHPGHGNPFEIQTESELALIYNDQSVLENMHIALAWRLLKNEECNIVSLMTSSQKRRFREVLIKCVLATDMSKHSVHSETLDNLVQNYIEHDFETIEASDWTSNEYLLFADQFLPVALHTADLGNPAKPIIFYSEWVDRVMNEFFNQGDKERLLSLPISMLCDRFKVNVHAGQVGFINFVIRPWFSRWAELLDGDEHGILFLQILEDNFQYMLERANQTKDAQEEIKRLEEQLIERNEISNIEYSNHNNNHRILIVNDIIINEQKKPIVQIVDVPNLTPQTSHTFGFNLRVESHDDMEDNTPINDDLSSETTEHALEEYIIKQPLNKRDSARMSYSIVGIGIIDLQKKLAQYKDNNVISTSTTNISINDELSKSQLSMAL